MPMTNILTCINLIKITKALNVSTLDHVHEMTEYYSLLGIRISTYTVLLDVTGNARLLVLVLIYRYEHISMFHCSSRSHLYRGYV